MTASEAETLTPVLSSLACLPEMDERQFRRWAELLERRTGISVSWERRSFLITNLGLRMREVGFHDYQAYFDHLHSKLSGAVEWACLVHRLTVHETRFFRHSASLNLIQQFFLPRLPAMVAASRTIRAWSVGCATGEEAYTLAMLLDQGLAAKHSFHQYAVTATDISAEALTVGRKGIYSPRAVAGVEPEWRDRYFEERTDGGYQIRDALLRRVCFARLNVLELDSLPLPPMDLIVCQNMLIYFDRRRRAEIADRLAARLAPGGLLIFGPGELLAWSAPGLARVAFPGTLAYRRALEPSTESAS